jgi:hypothetical protein
MISNFPLPRIRCTLAHCHSAQAMPYLLVRHKVADFSTWQAAYAEYRWIQTW